MAFRAFKTWKEEFTRLPIDRLRNILWKPNKEAVENNCHETCCKAVSYITPTDHIAKMMIIFHFPSLLVLSSVVTEL